MRKHTPATPKEEEKEEEAEEPAPKEAAGPKCDHRKIAPPPPEHVARAYELLQAGANRVRANRSERIAIANDLAAVRDMSLAEVKHYLTRRQLDIALYHLGGMSYPEIVRIVGLKNKRSCHAHMKNPAVRRFIELVDQARIERVISGEYGVRAQAKAAAPAVMEHMVEKAGGRKIAGGRQGVAARDADAIRAADLVLTVAGEKVERSEHHHVHELFATMTTDELRVLGDTGVWPDRLQRTVGALGLGQKRLNPPDEVIHDNVS